MENFKGKCLVRKSRLSDGKEVLIICGIFHPSEPIQEYSNKDEMWNVEFSIEKVRKFEYTNSTGYPYSPEDFLTGFGQRIDSGLWKEKR